MKTKSTWILALVALAVAGMAWLLINKVPTTRDREGGRDLLAFDRDAATTVTLKNDGATLVLSKRGSRWQLTSPLEADADPSRLNDLLNAAEFLRIHQEIPADAVRDTPSLLTDYGLDAPAETVTIESNGKMVTVQFGKETALPGRLYARLAGRDAVYVVDASLRDLARLSADEYRDRRFLNVAPPAVQSVTLETGGQSMTFVRDGDQWKMTRPFTARADRERLEDWLSDLATSQIGVFTQTPAEGAKGDGLATPPLVVRLTSDEQETPIVVEFGGPAPELPPPPPSEFDDPNAPPPGPIPQVFARATDQPFVVTVPADLLEIKVNAPDSLRDHQLAPVNLDLVDRVRVTPDKLPPYLLERAGEGWQVAGESPLAADPAEVARFLETVTRTQGQAFLPPDTPELALFTSPVVAVALLAYSEGPTAEAGPGEQPVANLEFARDEKAAYARVEGEPGILVLAPEILERLPLSGLAFQRLALAEFAPDKLTSLTRQMGTSQIQLAHTDQGWRLTEGEGVLDLAAADSLATALSKLRAVRWVGLEQADMGFEHPTALLRFSVGDAPARTLTLGARDDNGMTYGKLSDRQGVFLLNRPDTEILQSPLLQSSEAPPAHPATPANTAVGKSE